MVFKLREFWRQCGLAAVAGGCWSLGEGPRSETSDLEAGLPGLRFDQLSWLWENVPSCPPWWTSLIPLGSLKTEASRGHSLFPSLCRLSARSISCFCLTFSWAGPVPSQGLHSGYERKGRHFRPLLVSTSRNPNQHFILVSDKNLRERGLCAAYRFIGYKAVVQCRLLEILLTCKITWDVRLCQLGSFYFFSILLCLKVPTCLFLVRNM